MPRDFPGAASNHFSVGDVPAVDITGPTFSVCAWAQPDTHPYGSGSGTRIVVKGASGLTTTQYDFTFKNNGDGITARIACAVGDASTVDEAVGTNVGTGAWVHMAAVKDASVLGVYKNGVLDGSVASTRSIQNTPDSMVVGSNPANNRFLDGRMADVAIWAVALTADEIAALAKGVSPAMIRRTSLRGYWPLVGLSLASEADLSGGGNNLAQTGSVAVSSVSPPGGRWATFAAG